MTRKRNRRIRSVHFPGAVLLTLAMPLLARPLERAAQSQEEILRQAESDLSSGRVEMAGKALSQVLEINPSLVPARILLGRLLLQTDKLDDAAAQFTAAIQAGDDPGKNAQYGMGLVLLEKSQYQDALRFLTAASQAQPKDLPRLYALISAELEQDVKAARTHRKQFDAVSPARPDISYKLGMLFLQHHMQREAEPELRRVARMIEGESAHALTPENVSALFLELARLRFQGRDYWQALHDLARIPHSATSDQTGQEILLLTGRSLIAVGEPARGAQKLQEAVEKDVSNAGAQIQLVWGELLANRWNDARDLVQKLEVRWPQVPEVDQIAALVARESLSPRAHVPWSNDWHLKGEGVVCCPCKVPCPCRSNGLPSQPHCEATGAYRIAQGHYGHVRLDDFVFATVQANMGTSQAPLTLFAATGATDEQLIALERIYQAFNPLQPVIFPTVVRVPISFRTSKRRREYAVKVPQRLEMQIERRLEGGSSPWRQTAAVDPFANAIEYARNIVYKAWDVTGKLQWDFSGRQANLRFIDLDARDYAQGGILFQFQDGSGFFNEKQMELIGKLKLSLPAAPVAAGSEKVSHD